MNPIAATFLVVAALALPVLPRKWAPLPLLVGACYMTLGQAIDLGPFRFTVIRILVLTGLVRVLARGERPAGGLVGLDWLVMVWGGWVLLSSAFHPDPGETLTFHLGMFYNVLGIYFLFRCFCQSFDDATRIAKMIAILLVPVALEMLCEKLLHRNLFAVLGGVGEEPTIRNGRLRAQGPFAVSILAGTVGAVCAPLLVGIWRKEPLAARVGLAACLLMVVTCASSGPLLSVFAGIAALAFWRWRRFTRHVWVAAIVGYLLLDLVMKAPAYYLVARVDLVGGSTGYHRAALIQSSIEHINEWWFAGTDYTRDWMPYGVGWSEDHADITNHYLGQGVRGGLLLMLLFMSFLWWGFRAAGQLLRLRPPQDHFFVWCVGAALFVHAVSCTSIAYFDQSFIFIYLTLAVTASLRAITSEEVAKSPETVGITNEEMAANVV